MRTPKENKRKPRNRTLKSAAGTIPKAALKTAWIKTKEQTRTAARENDTDPRQQEPTDLAGSAAEQSASFVLRQGRKLAETQTRQHRQEEAAARAHAANKRGVSPKQTEYGTLPDAAQRPRRGADLPRQRAKEKVVTAKTAPRDIRGVTQGQRQLRTAANETVRSITTQAQMQTRAQKIRFAAKKVAGGTGRTAVAVRSAIRNFLADLHSLTAILAAGASAALGIVIVISLVAFVSGSAYGIFFAADAPNAASVTVREAVDTLTAEYRDRLEEISETVQHDRQDITANDDVYYIRWQDVLAVFSSYVSGNEQGAPVAALTKNQVDKLREIMWAMNAVDYSTRAETDRNDGQERKAYHRNHNRNGSCNTSYPQNAGRNGGRLPLYRPPKHIPATPARPAVRGTVGRVARWFCTGQRRTYEPGQHPHPDRQPAMAAAGCGCNHLTVRPPRGPDYWRSQLPHRHRHCLCRGYADPRRRRWHRHRCQRSGQLGRQLRLLHSNRPRRRAGNIVRPLFVHLRHHRSAGAVGRGYRICWAYRKGNRQPFASGGER